MKNNIQRTSLKIEMLKDQQRIEKEDRRKVLKKEDLFNPRHEEEEVERPITPLGPLNRKAEN